MVYRRRPDLPSDPAALLRQMRDFRQRMIELNTAVRIGGPLYESAHVITGAIDDMAATLTGRREYFWLGYASGAGQVDTRDEEWAAIERGEKPWPRG
jgi:hypothetical protein